jgi:dihydrofolate reductase
MTNYVYVVESLDGYIADKNRTVSWLKQIENPKNDDYGFADFMEKIDVVVMGANTFKEILEFDIWAYNKPVCILSYDKNIIPEELKDKAFQMSGDILEIYEELQDKGFKNFYIDGAEVIQSFLKHNLIDEMYITRAPMLLGGGISLFKYLEKQITFEFLGSEVFQNSLVKNHYALKKEF